MNAHVVAGFSEKFAEAISRRVALLPAGVAVAAALLPAPASASKASKKAKKKAKKKVKQACQAQVAECRSVFLDFCLGLPGPPPGCLEFIEAEFGPCCDLLATCDGAASSLCFLEKGFEVFSGP